MCAFTSVHEFGIAALGTPSIAISKRGAKRPPTTSVGGQRCGVASASHSRCRRGSDQGRQRLDGGENSGGRTFPTFVVDATGQVLACDDLTRGRLAEEGLGRMASGRMILSRAAARTVRDAIGSLAQAPSLRRKAGALETESRGSKTALWLLIERCAGRADTGNYQVSVRNPARFGSYDEDILLHSLGFTPSETSLTMSLARGETIKDHAQRTGRRVATVRWHLSNALAKAHCRSQSELFRLLLLLSI